MAGFQCYFMLCSVLTEILNVQLIGHDTQLAFAHCENRRTMRKVTKSDSQIDFAFDLVLLSETYSKVIYSDSV